MKMLRLRLNGRSSSARQSRRKVKAGGSSRYQVPGECMMPIN